MEKIPFGAGKIGVFQHELPGFITESADHPGVFDFHVIHHRFPTVSFCLQEILRVSPQFLNFGEICGTNWSKPIYISFGKQTVCYEK